MHHYPTLPQLHLSGFEISCCNSLPGREAILGELLGTGANICARYVAVVSKNRGQERMNAKIAFGTMYVLKKKWNLK